MKSPIGMKSVLLISASFAGLANSSPRPSPEMSAAPEPSSGRIKWNSVAREKDDLNYLNLENFLTSVPEDAGHCPPTQWVSDFWDETMAYEKWKGDYELERDVDEAFRHCKPVCMGIFPNWWEMEPAFQEMINMPHVPHQPLTAKRILEEVNGRNCACIYCLRFPGELLGLDDPSEWYFHYDNRFLRLTDEQWRWEGFFTNAYAMEGEVRPYRGYEWDSCTCVPNSNPEGAPEGAPEGDTEAEASPEGSAEAVAEAAPEAQPEAAAEPVPET